MDKHVVIGAAIGMFGFAALDTLGLIAPFLTTQAESISPPPWSTAANSGSALSGFRGPAADAWPPRKSGHHRSRLP